MEKRGRKKAADTSVVHVESVETETPAKSEPTFDCARVFSFALTAKYWDEKRDKTDPRPFYLRLRSMDKHMAAMTPLRENERPLNTDFLSHMMVAEAERMVMKHGETALVALQGVEDGKPSLRLVEEAHITIPDRVMYDRRQVFNPTASK